jgi:hypothetical protein
MYLHGLKVCRLSLPHYTPISPHGLGNEPGPNSVAQGPHTIRVYYGTLFRGIRLQAEQGSHAKVSHYYESTALERGALIETTLCNVDTA